MVELADVIAVTVTYGKRASLVSRCVKSLYACGVGHILVVDNGTGTDWDTLLGDSVLSASGATKSVSQVRVIALKTNLGSAGGYAEGIRLACELKAKAILLMDDDNTIDLKNLKVLLSAFNSLRPKHELVSVFGLRQGHGDHHVINYRKKQRVRTSNSVFEFHIADVPTKIWQRIRKPKASSGAAPHIPEFLAVDHAPYGGMMFGPELVETVGLPNQDFVLYQDDIEFSRRIKEASGSIYLVPECDIIDLEHSWNIAQKRKSAVSAFVNNGSDFQVYYTFRNRAYLDKTYNRKNSEIYFLNLSIYMVLIGVTAARSRKWHRLNLLWTALADARAGRLGISSTYELV